MFSDVEYNTISFTPVHGESSKGRDLRLKGYNIFAKRLFGQFSLVAENENTTTIPVPDAFKNRVHIKENMYQIDRNNVSDNSFQQFQQSLNNPNTNPVLQGNQEEQVKKFAELQERLNNKEFLEGAKNAFESSEELQQFGTQEQYNDYIARVSLGIVKNPSSGEYNYDSKVKDIVYHGTDAIFEKFDKTFYQSGVPNYIYFGKKGKPGLKDGNRLIAAVLNIKNPDYFIDTLKGKYTPNSDGFVEDYSESFFNSLSENQQMMGEFLTQYGVKEPEQIHILGSKQDIEGFKEFVRKSLPLEQQEQLKQKESNLQEYNKVKKAETMEEVKAQMLKDFDSYDPQFKDLLSWEKEMFIDMMSEGEINTYC
jgi:hypothetical protein